MYRQQYQQGCSFLCFFASCLKFLTLKTGRLEKQTNMWRKTGQFILANRIPLLIVLIVATALMGFFASKVQLSYEFTRAIPVNHPANKTYQAFKQKYGQDGSLLVIGIQTTDFFNEKLFNDYADLIRESEKSKWSNGYYLRSFSY